MSETLVCWVGTEPLDDDTEIEFHPEGPGERESRNGTPMRRAPEFDAHAPGPVPHRALFEAGWTVTCNHCEHELDEDGCLNCPEEHADEDCTGCDQCEGPPHYDQDCYVVFDQRGRAYCGPVCLRLEVRRRATRTPAPWLACPVCRAPAFEAVPCPTCGTEECTCDETGWVWYETPWRFCDGCGCGVRVDVSDGVAQVDYDEDVVPSE